MDHGILAFSHSFRRFFDSRVGYEGVQGVFCVVAILQLFPEILAYDRGGDEIDRT